MYVAHVYILQNVIHSFDERNRINVYSIEIAYK